MVNKDLKFKCCLFFVYKLKLEVKYKLMEMVV